MEYSRFIKICIASVASVFFASWCHIALSELLSIFESLTLSWWNSKHHREAVVRKRIHSEIAARINTEYDRILTASPDTKLSCAVVLKNSFKSVYLRVFVCVCVCVCWGRGFWLACCPNHKTSVDNTTWPYITFHNMGACVSKSLPQKLLIVEYHVDNTRGYLLVLNVNLHVEGWMIQAYSRLSTTHGRIIDCKLLVCMYWPRLVLVRPAASLYSASPLKHHATGKQWCPNPDPCADRNVYTDNINFIQAFNHLPQSCKRKLSNLCNGKKNRSCARAYNHVHIWKSKN